MPPVDTEAADGLSPHEKQAREAVRWALACLLLVVAGSFLVGVAVGGAL